MFPHLEKLVQQNSTEQDLKRGSTNKPAVSELQTALYQSGFAEELKWAQFGADGSYGNGTTNAVKAFSSKVNLTSTGESVSTDVCSQLLTRSAEARDLRQVKKSGTVLKRGSSDRAGVKALQRLLNQLGYGEQLNWARFKDDGSYGNGTSAAVKAFGQKEGITTNGEQVDPSLVQKMVDKLSTSFGSGWADVQDAPAASGAAHRVRGKGKGQFKVLFPNGKRDFEWVKNQFSGLRKEDKWVEQVIDGKKMLVKASGTHEYRYEFEDATYKLQKDAFEIDHKVVKKMDAIGNRVASFYGKEEHPKKQIVIHYTAGQITGDLPMLSRDGKHISTAYVIDRDGTIYRMFSPKQWAYHLGAWKPFAGVNQTTVGIELCNFGHIIPDGAGNLTFGNNSVYCSKEEKDAYVELSHPFRGFNHFASHTGQQYESLIMLLRYLTELLNIPRTFLSTDAALESQGKWNEIPRYRRFKDTAEQDAFSGICTHANYRPTDKESGRNAWGKWDIGPAFDWKKVIEGVSAETYMPELMINSRGMFDEVTYRDEATLHSSDHGLNHGDIHAEVYGPEGPEVDI